MMRWRCAIGGKCRCRLIEKEACRNWRPGEASGIGNITEGPLVASLAYVFAQLRPWAKSEDDRRGRSGR